MTHEFNWIPKSDEKFWHINVGKNTIIADFYIPEYDSDLIVVGNFFKTKKAAKLALERTMKIFQEDK